MHQEGPKRQGRFIKRTDRILKSSVAVLDYAFDAISETTIQPLDNTNRSLLHTKYHDPDELKKALRQPENFTASIDPDRRPVIFPRDFTKDWQRERDRQKKRNTRLMDEDDDYDMQMEEEARAAHEAAEKAKAANAIPVVAEVTEKIDVAPAPTSATPTVEQENLRQFKKNLESIDAVGRAINDLANPNGTLADGSPNSQFVPVDIPEAGQTVQDQEVHAAAEARHATAKESIDPAALQAVHDEAREMGYQDGFRVGEEKASLQVRQTAAALFANIQQLTEDLMHLKDDVLKNVQDNFYNVCQAMAEGLIRREFSLHPDTFVTVVRRAVADAVPGNEFKIHVHPKYLATLEKLDLGDLTKAFVPNESVVEGNFRIESQLTSVDGNIHNIVKDLLNKADLDLFGTDSGKKVG